MTFDPVATYTQLCAEMLCDPLAPTPRVDWFADRTDPQATQPAAAVAPSTRQIPRHAA